MPMKTTFTARIVPARRLLPVAALWALLRRVGFVDFLDSDSSELGFVLDHPSKLVIGPLMQPLVHLAAKVDSITDAADITDSNRRDTSLKEHLHDLPAQFVKEVRDLVVDVVELFLLRPDKLLPAVRSRLFAADLRIELCFQLILIVTKSAELPAADRECIVAGEDSGKVLLPKIDSSDLVASRTVNRFCLVLSTNHKPTGTLPDLDGSRLRVYRLVDQDRVLSTFRGQAENAVVPKHDALVSPPEHVVGLIAALRRIALAVALVPRADCFVELLGYLLGCLRRKHVVTFAVPLAHRRLTEPVVLRTGRSPVPLADVIPQFSRSSGQPLELLGTLNMEFASQVHALRLIFDVLLDDRLAYFSGCRDEITPRPERRKAMKMIKLFSQYVSTCSLESVNHLIRCVTGVCLHEKMNVVRPDRQRINLPLVLLCYIEKNLFQTVATSPLRTLARLFGHHTKWYFTAWTA
jgi:hypothetical protein